MRSKIVIAGAAGLLLAALPVLAKTTHKAKPKATPAETAVIENTGSTNTHGYRITVTASGTAAYSMTGRIGMTTPDKARLESLPRSVAAALFRDLAAAMPLTDLPARHGMRSASFGTRTFITYMGQRSPDLTFGGDAHTAALLADVDAITQALHVGNTPRRPAVHPPAPLPPNRD